MHRISQNRKQQKKRTQWRNSSEDPIGFQPVFRSWGFSTVCRFHFRLTNALDFLDSLTIKSSEENSAVVQRRNSREDPIGFQFDTFRRFFSTVFRLHIYLTLSTSASATARLHLTHTLPPSFYLSVCRACVYERERERKDSCVSVVRSFLSLSDLLQWRKVMRIGSLRVRKPMVSVSVGTISRPAASRPLGW